MTGLRELSAADTYDRYLRRLDARAVLEHYGAQRCTEQINRRDGTTEIVHSCLLDRIEPHHAHGDTNPSAACNLDKKKYVCYSLGWGGDLLAFIRFMEGKAELRDALSLASNFLTEAVVSAQSLAAELERVFDGETYAVELPSYDPVILAKWEEEGHPYWAHRGITAGTIEAYRLGYDPVTRRVVFPHFFDHKLVGWQKRAIPGESVTEDPKYRSSPGMPRSETLYNYDEASQHARVCVVESPMSVVYAHSLGLPNVVATFGSKISAAQIRLLAEGDFETIYVWFDRDGAGLPGEKKLTSGLYRRAQVRIVTPDWKRDLADCSLEEIAVKLKRATPAALKLGQYDLFGRGHHGR